MDKDKHYALFGLPAKPAIFIGLLMIVAILLLRVVLQRLNDKSFNDSMKAVERHP